MEKIFALSIFRLSSCKDHLSRCLDFFFQYNEIILSWNWVDNFYVQLVLDQQIDYAGIVSTQKI